MKTLRVTLAALSLLFLSQASFSSSPPPMGWNSWNFFGYKINDRLIRHVIEALRPLKELGYHYVVIDGGWEGKKLGPRGGLTYNKDKFPKGIAPLAAYAHKYGLKLGVHVTAGSEACSQRSEGSYGHEREAVASLKEWGVDFVKVDKCFLKEGWTEIKLKDAYTRWSKALNPAGIVLSIDTEGFHPWTLKLAHMSRTTRDIAARYHTNLKAQFNGSLPKRAGHYIPLTVMEIAHANNKFASYAGHGHWNDADILVTGPQGLTLSEQKNHLALWALMTSPLFMGNDPRHMSSLEHKLVTNKEVIAIDQDTTEQGRLVKKEHTSEVWLKHLKGGKRALLLLNLDPARAHTITYTLKGTKKWHVLQVYTHKKDLPASSQITRTVAPDSGRFLLLTPYT